MGHMALLLLTLPALLRGTATAEVAAVGAVCGNVQYADTGKPAGGIRLWLTTTTARAKIHPDPKTGEYVLQDTSGGEERLFAVVSADGTFAVHDVPVGTYLVHTYSPPYLSPDGTIFPTSNAKHVAVGPQTGSGALTVEITAGQPNQRLNVLLKRGGVIEGQVHGTRGTPSAGTA